MSATASEAKHTPTPWVGFYDQGKPYAIFPAGRRGEICTFAEPTPTEADHTFIIRAANAHDALIDALTSARGYVAAYESEHESNKAMRLLADIDAALALAGASS